MSDRDESKQAGSGLYSVGHSTHSFEQLVALLQLYRIEVVGDVRTAPFSRFNPQFNRRELEHGLKDNEVQYVFLGRELGGGRRAMSSTIRTVTCSTAGWPRHRSSSRARAIDRWYEPVSRSDDVQRGGSYRLPPVPSHHPGPTCSGVPVTHIRGDGTTQRTQDIATYADWEAGSLEQASLFDESVRSPWSLHDRFHQEDCQRVLRSAEESPDPASCGRPHQQHFSACRLRQARRSSLLPG